MNTPSDKLLGVIEAAKVAFPKARCHVKHFNRPPVHVLCSSIRTDAVQRASGRPARISKNHQGRAKTTKQTSTNTSQRGASRRKSWLKRVKNASRSVEDAERKRHPRERRATVGRNCDAHLWRIRFRRMRKVAEQLLLQQRSSQQQRREKN